MKCNSCKSILEDSSETRHDLHLPATDSSLTELLADAKGYISPHWVCNCDRPELQVSRSWARAPTVVAIVIDRFEHEVRTATAKVHTIDKATVSFDDNVDFADWVADGGRHNYELVAVINYNSAKANNRFKTGGNYSTFVRGVDSWINVTAHLVRESRRANMHTKTSFPYILFYAKC